MSQTSHGQTGNLTSCPYCQRELTFVAAWTYRGLWGYNEVRAYECAEHGPIFFGPQAAVVRTPERKLHEDHGDSDRDSLVSAPRRPVPTPNANAIAISEPDLDSNS